MPVTFTFRPNALPGISGNASYRSLLRSGARAGAGGGPANTLSGPFLPTCLLYFIGYRLGGLSIRWCKGGELGVTASEHGGLLYTCWTHSLDISSEQIWKGCNKKKKKPASEWKPNCGKWIHFQPLTLPSPLPTSSAKPAASVIDLIHSWFSQRLGGHLILVCSHYRTWEFIWRVGRWYVVWFERYTPWRLPSC